MTAEMKKEIAKDLVELLVGKEKMDSFREWEKKNKETKKEISKQDLLDAISKAMSTVYGLSSVKDDNCPAVTMIILNEIFGEEEENKEEESNGKAV